MLDHTTAAMATPATRPSSTRVTSWVEKTFEKWTDWYQRISVQKPATVEATRARAPRMTRLVTSGLRRGVLALRPGRDPPDPPDPPDAPGPSKPPLAGPKSLLLTWDALNDSYAVVAATITRAAMPPRHRLCGRAATRHTARWSRERTA